jgi:hypothetical protein
MGRTHGSYGTSLTYHGHAALLQLGEDELAIGIHLKGLGLG